MGADSVHQHRSWCRATKNGTSQQISLGFSFPSLPEWWIRIANNSSYTTRFGWKQKPDRIGIRLTWSSKMFWQNARLLIKQSPFVGRSWRRVFNLQPMAGSQWYPSPAADLHQGVFSNHVSRAVVYICVVSDFLFSASPSFSAWFVFLTLFQLFMSRCPAQACCEPEKCIAIRSKMCPGRWGPYKFNGSHWAVDGIVPPTFINVWSEIKDKIRTRSRFIDIPSSGL